MSLASPLASPIYAGNGTSVEVPSKWDLSLNGRKYMVDTKYASTGSLSPTTNWSRRSVALLKPQQDQAALVGEQSLNPEDFARRAQDTWHKGCGQTFLDRPESDAARFHTSLGMDVWTKYQMGVLNATSLVRSSANTNCQMVTVGGYVYAIDGQSLVFSTTAAGLASPTTVTGTPAATATSIASDGNNVWVCYGASGMYTTTRGAAAATRLVSTALASDSIVGYVKGRLLVSKGPVVYNITSLVDAAVPAALFTQANPDFVWTGFGEGPANIYLAGFSGDKSLIYRTAILTDGTALASPAVAGELPDGEIVRCVQGYLGYLTVGTDTGFRLASIDSNGNLNIGARVAMSNPVKCFEPQDRFIWFGWTNYDTSNTGLGRMDLTVLNATAPAYASDLMAAAQGTVLSVCTFGGVRLFAVSGAGFYAEGATKVTSATLTTGQITYGLPDNKVAINLGVTHAALAGTITPAIALDGSSSFLNLTANSTAGSTSYTATAAQSTGTTFELQFTVTSATAATQMTRWTLEANPAPGRGQFFYVPLLLWDTVETAIGTPEHMDTDVEYGALTDMQASGLPLTYQDAGGTVTVFLDDHEFLIHGHNKDRTFFNGTFVAKIRKPRA